MIVIDRVIEQIGAWLETPENNADKTVSGGAIVVNGVALPKIVAEQVGRLGVSLSWYTPYELEAAVRNSAVDCNVIDDPDGKNFLDALEIDHDDEEKKEEQEFDPYRLSRLYSNTDSATEGKQEASFRDRLRAERERGKRSAAQKETARESGEKLPDEPRCAGM